MSHFYGTVSSKTGSTNRCGHVDGGITGHIRGWDLGVNVRAIVDANGDDVVEIYLTGGSNGSAREVFLGRYKREGGGYTRVYVGEEIPYLYKPGEE